MTWPFAAADVAALDGDDRDGLSALMVRHQFRSIVDCSGNCALRACEIDPGMARRINVDSARAVLDAIGAAPVRLIRLSCDLVYSGRDAGGYVESDPPDPVTAYGATMVESERLVLERRPDALVLRISLPMGESFNGHAGAIDWIQSRFAKGRPATLYFDEVRTPTYVDDMNVAFERLLASDLAGLFHFGGPTRLSLYQIAQVVNRVGGYDPELLIGCPRIEAGPIPPRAGNVSMDSAKLEKALGGPVFRPWPADPELMPTTRDWHRGGWRGRPLEVRRRLYAPGSGKIPR